MAPSLRPNPRILTTALSYQNTPKSIMTKPLRPLGG